MTKKKTTAEKPAKPAKPLEGQQELPFDPLDKLTPEAHNKAAESLRTSCHELTYSIGWLPTAKRVSDHNRKKMLDSVQGKKKGYSVSKRLFITGHPLIDELNAARRSIDQWRDAYTLVKAGDQAAGDEEQEGSERRLKVASGVRLIRDADIEEFDAGFNIRAEVLMKAADKLQEHLDQPYNEGDKIWPSIKDWDKEQIGDDFHPADYPSDVRECIRITKPQYSEYTISHRLPPEIYKREADRLHEALSGTVETAVGVFTKTINDTFLTLAKQLVNRVRVYPDKEGEYGKYHEAEVVSTKTRDQDVTIPVGHIKVELRYKEDPKAAGKSIVEWIGPMLKGDYEASFKPRSTGEQKKITTSVIDHMLEQLANAKRLKEMLGGYGSRIDDVLESVRDTLSHAGSAAGEIATEIKSSKTFRAQLAEALDEAAEALDATAVQAVKVRRKLSKQALV